MITFIRILVLLTFVTSPLQAEQPFLEKQELFAAGQSGFSLYRIPGIVVTNQGTILAYCEARKHGGKDWGEIEIHLCRSTDNGLTFSPPQHIAHHGERIPLTVKTTEGRIEQTVNNPVAINDTKTGVIHFLYCVNYARAFHIQSSDDGLTWTSPIEITATFETFRQKHHYSWTVLATGPGHGIQLKNDRLIVPVWLASGKDGAHHPSVAATIYSDDQGKTWHAGDIALPNDPDHTNPNETVIAQLSDGRVMLNARSTSKASRRLITTSPDGSANWNTPAFDPALPDPQCMGSLITHPNPPNGKPLLIFANPHSLKRDAEHHEIPGASGPRENLTIKLSEDDGKTWPIQKTLEPGGSGYSDLAVLPDGTILCFYERSPDGLNSVGLLTLARLNLAWLKQKEDIRPTQTMQEAGTAVANRVIATSSKQTGYMFDLTLEALLELSRITNNSTYRDHVLRIATNQRKLTPTTPAPWRQQPFNCLTFALFEATQDKSWLPIFLSESERCRNEIWRDPDGIILHPRGTKRGGGEAMLIDALQEYTSRMARTGFITKDPAWFAECARQFRLYRPIVRYPDSGLWSQGRGWISGQPSTLSPGAWSRGHGWLIRGMEQSLRYIPRDAAEYQEIQTHLSELADALLAVQLPSGMWSCLLTRSPDQSPAETSGTAMIAWHLARAIHDGHLTDPKYLASVKKALAALPQYVLTDGTVFNTSPGPGPLETEEPWLKSEYPPGDPHGTFSILFAAAAAYLLDN
ncbi:hypothetical protein FEM03_15720 [Phragmitibacter flavus]|uniref:exo-alpha-sialidase n=1 Tax=Phragmitibacter flavus TaxID=2576071 RepID=A0A5R8KBU3_9BACT|nr:glycoside hydrolase family 88 protein [Phragmitibacter flavus]TLD69772.1 hypothetical protein FEM03_15720 [Phragmitibacter flavus]